MKNPLTPAGIEFVAQNLNHCANAVPVLFTVLVNLESVLFLG